MIPAVAGGLFLIVLLVLAALAFSRPTGGTRLGVPVMEQPGAGPRPAGVPGNWTLVLNSPFSGSTLNTSLWRPGWFGTGITGPINAEESACYDSDNVSLPHDGTVHLNVTGVPSTCAGQARPFTGSVLSTNPDDGRSQGGFEFRYGVLEARVYLPGIGAKFANWPSILTLGQIWPQDGEDDVIENVLGTICAHFHSPGYEGGAIGSCDSSFTPGWHVVSSNWEPHSVTWYYDGIEIGHATRGITSAPMYIVLVNTVSAQAPQLALADSMKVAYVRVWQRSVEPGGSPLGSGP